MKQITKSTKFGSSLKAQTAREKEIKQKHRHWQTDDHSMLHIDMQKWQNPSFFNP
jgi:hypothetical protein